MSVFSAVLKRDLLLLFRNRGELMNPLVFFLLVASLFPLGVDPDPRFLSKIAPGLVWVAALLSTLLALDTLFRADYDDGTLEQLLLSPQPTYVIVLAKVIAHWLLTGLPLVLISPLLGLMLFLPSEGMVGLMLSLLLGTPSLCLMGAIGAALTVGLKKGGMLVSLLVLPLYVPVLIFGSAAVQGAIVGTPINGLLALLGAFLALALVIAPLAVSVALKISVSE
ncbi:MAG: heme exporter protein CcmB [Pontibacterium sp.]